MDREASTQVPDQVAVRLLDRIPAAVAYYDVGRRNVFANPEYAAWLGHTVDGILGAHLVDVLGPEVYEENLAWIDAAFAGEEQRWTRALPDPSWAVRHSLTTYLPELDDGEVVGVLVLGTDVTEQVERANAALTTHNALLQDVIGHDLRNPITATAGFLQLALAVLDAPPAPDLAEGDDGSSQVATFVRSAARTTRRAQTLLADVLAMASAESGAVVAHLEPVSLQRCVRDALAVTDVACSVSVDVAEDLRVRADPSQLQQVVANILINADRHGAPPVTVTASVDGSRVRLDVADGGGAVFTLDLAGLADPH